MRAGELRQRITLQQSTKSRDTMGAEVIVWVTAATVWAEKLHQSSREFFAAQKVNAEITDLFKTRFRQKVDTKMRLVYGGKTYNILGADDPDGRRRDLWLLCREAE